MPRRSYHYVKCIKCDDHYIYTKARKLATCDKCGTRITVSKKRMISPKDISKHRGPPAQESSQSPPERPTDFWGMIKSQRDQDKDILRRLRRWDRQRRRTRKGGRVKVK